MALFFFFFFFLPFRRRRRPAFFFFPRPRRRRRPEDFLPSLLSTLLAAALSLLAAMYLTRWEGLRAWTPEYPDTRSLTRPPTTLTFDEPLLLLAPADLLLRRVTAGIDALRARPCKALSCALERVSYLTKGLLPPTRTCCCNRFSSVFLGRTLGDDASSLSVGSTATAGLALPASPQHPGGKAVHWPVQRND